MTVHYAGPTSPTPKKAPGRASASGTRASRRTVSSPLQRSPPKPPNSPPARPTSTTRPKPSRVRPEADPLLRHRDGHRRLSAPLRRRHLPATLRRLQRQGHPAHRHALNRRRSRRSRHGRPPTRRRRPRCALDRRRSHDRRHRNPQRLHLAQTSQRRHREDRPHTSSSIPPGRKPPSASSNTTSRAATACSWKAPTARSSSSRSSPRPQHHPSHRHLPAPADGSLKGTVTEKRFGDLSEEDRYLYTGPTPSSSSTSTAASLAGLHRVGHRRQGRKRRSAQQGPHHHLRLYRRPLRQAPWARCSWSVPASSAAKLCPSTTSHEGPHQSQPDHAGRDDFTIELPPGYAVDEIPDPVKLDLGFASYESSSTAQEQRLHYTRTYTVREVTLPADKYPDVQKLAGVIAADEESSAVLKQQLDILPVSTRFKEHQDRNNCIASNQPPHPSASLSLCHLSLAARCHAQTSQRTPPLKSSP